MPAIVPFPPFNPGAFDVPADLFNSEDNLPIRDNRISISVPDSAASTNDLEKLWDHLLTTYWPELYDLNSLRIASGTGAAQQPTLLGANTIILNIFRTFVTDFEGEFLKNNLGITNPADFYDPSNFSDQSRIEAWDGFVRVTDVGQKHFNVLLFVWDLILKILEKMQDSTINKTTSQRWMNEAQKKGVSKMAQFEFKKQDDAEDFDTIHENQNITHDLDIVRGERSSVQRLSTEKSSDAGNSQERMQETNTFLALLIDQLGNALRSVVKK